MGVSSRGGKPFKDSSPGSRFSRLETLKDDEYPLAGMHSSRKRSQESYQTTSFFNKSKRLADLQSGPKYILMVRNESDLQKSMQNISPFTIQKSITHQAGEPKSIKRLRNGTLLIETVNKKQSDKLCQMTTLTSDIHVRVYEHPTLNQSKGTIYCRDLIYETDEVLKTELAAQFVVDIHRIKKKKKTTISSTQECLS